MFHRCRSIGVILIALLAAPTGVFAQAAPLAPQNSSGPKRYDYSGVGVPDAAMVQRVATTLGIGKTVDVTTGSKKLRAKIQSIDVSGFTVTHGRTPVAQHIAYDQVTRLKPAGWPLGAKIGLAAGAGVGGLILGSLAYIYNCQCS